MSKHTPITKTALLSNPSVHVWAAICYFGNSNLKLLKCNETWNGNTLIETYNEKFFELQQKWYPTGKYYYVHDNARPHVFGIFNEFIEKKIPIRVKHPARSPDLNPIEKIWSILKEKVQKYFINIF